jgi:hypothetical protein
MAGYGDKLWEIGRSPGQHLSLLVVGLFSLLTGRLATALLPSVGGGGALVAMTMLALVLSGIGVFFVALALFLGAYTAEGDSLATTVWRIAQLLAAVLVLVFLI